MNRNLATLVLLSTFIGFAADGQLVPPAVVPGTALPKAAPPALIAPAISPLTPAPIAPAAKPEEPSVNWQGLYRQSALFLGVEHAFRLATEAGTRGAKGPFLQGYVNSVSNLHGWSDGDPFYVNYIGHPMQGSVAGYIWAQNDRRYASVKFGKNSTYWKSRLRATGYAWAYSTLFEIGPLSEASIGYIQSKHPQQGLVDHVVTPVIGLGWMVGEDAIDRYLLTGLEQRVRNTYVRAFARSFLNPTRSMANLMAFRVPFYRDGRSIFTEKSQVRSISTEEPDEQIREDDGPAPLEVTAIYSGYRLGSSRSCTGGGAEAAFRLASDWQLVLDVHGCELGGLPK
ncbi:MAG TPA: hypothetical protein VE621_24210, partial [Bryobacteraceae bacterium]|nr:hypothetical protein [Bryobacteraceae bacterium]